MRDPRDGAVAILMLVVLASMSPAFAAGTGGVMGKPEVQVVTSDADRTVLRIQFPVVTAPNDWRTVSEVTWPGLEAPVFDAEGQVTGMSPRYSRLLALRDGRLPTWRLLAAQWLREPDDPQAEPVVVTPPTIYRGVPLASVIVSPRAGGGVLSSVVVEVSHPDPGRDKALLDDRHARRAMQERVPASVVNPDVFRTERGLAAATAAVSATKDSFDDAFARTANWLRLEVPVDGMYHVTGADFEAAGVALVDVDPLKLRVFRGGGMVLPDNPEDEGWGWFPQDRLTEVAVLVRAGEQDGEWNLDDDVIFRGHAAATWRDRFDPSAARDEHEEHPFERHAIYWLTWEDVATASPFSGSPLRVDSSPAAPAGVEPTTAHLARYHGEENLAPVIGWLQDSWAWDSTVLSRFTRTFDLEGVLAGQPATFRMELAGIRGGMNFPPRLEVRGSFNNDQANGVEFDWLLTGQNNPDGEPTRFGGQTSALVPGSNRVVLDYQNYPQTQALIAFDSFDLEYLASLDKSDYALDLTAVFWADDIVEPATPVDVRFTGVGGEGHAVWDLTDPTTPVRLEGAAEGAAYTVGLQQDPGVARHLVLFDDSDLRSPSSRTLVSVDPLRQVVGTADYLVISPPEFMAAAERLAALRRRHLPGIDDPVALAVSTDDIYANFSGGQKDWRAIRQFLRWHFQAHGQRLRWACLLGDASIDHHNNFGHTPGVGLMDWVPADLVDSFPRVLYTNDPFGPFVTDDALVTLDAPPPGSVLGDAPDLGVGRLPANSASQAMALVERLERYVDTTPAGSWRNRVLLAADDQRYGGNDPAWSNDLHTIQAELLATEYVASSIEVSKLYMLEYPLVGGYKPDARRDLLAALNEGVTMFYYVGHGAAVTLADEHLFQIGDISGLNNGDRRFIFVAFSCDVGVYADPNTQCMAEEFLLAGQGGGIASIAASWVSTSNANDPLAAAFFEEYYPQQSVSEGASLGEALTLAKVQMWDLQFGTPPNTGYFRNARRYNLMGDPALRLPNPVGRLTFAEGASDSLLTGRLHQLAIDDPDGVLELGAATSYEVRVHEPTLERSFTNISGTVHYYRTVPNTVFRGNGTLDRQDVTVPFVAPRFLRAGEDAAFRFIVDDGSDLESIAVAQVPAAQVQASGEGDVSGPTINLAFAGNRVRVQPGDLLQASLADSNGINILATNPANSVLLEFDRSGIYNNVSADVVFEPGSYTRASLSTPVPLDLDLGDHIVVMTASDMFGNVGSDTLGFTLEALGIDAIYKTTVFPNPTTGPCRLICDVSGTMDLIWDIYTVSGRHIWRSPPHPADGPTIIEWDGRDTEGDSIANGVYLYVLRGTSPDSDHEIRETGQLVIMR